MRIERLSASNAAKHIACHASANLAAAIPNWQDPVEEDTKASARGTDLHALLEEAGQYSAKTMLGIARALEYVATLRMQRRFKQLLEADGEGWWLATKPRTKADVVLWVQDELHVVDYKFGVIPVDVLDNDQLKYYALAFSYLAPKAKGVTVHIVQPFADNIVSVFLTTAELEQFRQDSLKAETAIQAGSTAFGPSDHCQFCPANPHGRGTKGKPYCPAMMQQLYPTPALDAAAALM